MSLEGELSLEGANESGKIQERCETVKIILKELGYTIESFDY
jgi:hypothetical protein